MHIERSELQEDPAGHPVCSEDMEDHLKQYGLYIV